MSSAFKSSFMLEMEVIKSIIDSFLSSVQHEYILIIVELTAKQQRHVKLFIRIIWLFLFIISYNYLLYFYSDVKAKQKLHFKCQTC